MYLLRGDCEAEKAANETEWHYYLDILQEQFNQLANISGFTGGDSNRWRLALVFDVLTGSRVLSNFDHV